MTQPLAGKPAPSSILVDAAQLLRAYAETAPDPLCPKTHRCP